MALSDYEEIGGEFAEALTCREYTSAHNMTTQEYQQRINLLEMIKSFEFFCPIGYEEEEDFEINTGMPMESWSDKYQCKIGWIYISIGGIHNEALAIKIISEHNILKICDIEFGRP